MNLAHSAIDNGADLVLGHHPHVLEGIEVYNGKNIVYSLGNFCFGGNSNPSDKDTMIFQQTFTVQNGELVEDNVTNIILYVYLLYLRNRDEITISLHRWKEMRLTG